MLLQPAIRTTMPAGYILHGDGTSVDTTSQLFFNSSNLRFGIGTTSPASKLHINNGTNLNLLFNTTSLDATTTSRISSANDAVSAGVGLVIQGSPLAFTNNGGEGMRINNDGKVGIGTANPATKLEVATDGGANNITATAYRNDAGQNNWNSRFARGTMATPLIVQHDDAIGSFGFEPYNGTNFNLQTALIFTKVNGTVTTSSIPTDIYFHTDPTGTAYLPENRKMTIASGGAVTINNLAGSGSRAVNASATGILSASSSILIKENVENINYGLSDVLKLKPVIFNYIDKDKWGEGKELGFIAEDVMDIIPESTGTMNNSDIYFDLQKLIPVLTKAIQEQQALIKTLEQRLLILENK